MTYFPTYFPRSENHNDWVKGLTSTRQEAGFTVLNAASADVVNSAKCSKDFMEYEVCLCGVVKLKTLHPIGLGFESLAAHLLPSTIKHKNMSNLMGDSHFGMAKWVRHKGIRCKVTHHRTIIAISFP